MAVAADDQGFAALVGHELLPFRCGGSNSDEVGQCTDLVSFHFGSSMADLALASEKASDDFPVTVRCGAGDAVIGHRVLVAPEGNPSGPGDQWFPALPRLCGLEARAEPV